MDNLIVKLIGFGTTGSGVQILTRDSASFICKVILVYGVIGK